MSINVVNQTSPVNEAPKPKQVEAPKKETTLDRSVEWVKDHTKKGTFVGDHYIASTGIALVGGTSLIAGTIKLADKVPMLEKALEFTFEKNGQLLAGSVALGASTMLAEDAVESFKEGSSVKAGAETLGAAVAGLGGVELIGQQFNIPYVKDALSGPAEFVGDNIKAVTGGAAMIGGGVVAAKGVKDLQEGKKLQGGAELAGGAVGVLGGAELIGRQFNIPVMKEALTGPIKAIFTSKGGILVSGGAAAAAGLVAGGDGVRRLTQNKGFLNDMAGTAEVTAGVTGVTGGASLIGMATGSEKLARVFPENAQIIAGVGALGGAVALGKHTVNEIQEKGVTLWNTTKGTGAVMLGLGGTELIAGKMGVPVLEKAFSKGWQPALAIGLGAASYKLGSNALKEGQEFLDNPSAGQALNAAGQAGASLLAGAGSVGLVGSAFHIPVLEKASEAVLETAGKAVKPVFEMAVEHPFITLGVVAAAAGTGYYIYHKNQEAEKEAQKTQQ